MKELIKKIWNWIVSIPQDKLLHDYAAALITLFVFAIALLMVKFWVAFAIANAVAVLCIFGKEVYDYLKPEGHSVELADIWFGLFGMLKIDAALLLMAIVIA